ncbi:MAG: transcriptional regulator, LysR family [Ramlibacter sp.]|nr:transcriptional regulator, LysR family [Ramlibacter sp.]
MNINTVDLNLFLVFQAIFVTRSVTIAGERIGMTQSAVSAALRRLRERFNDPLYVRTTEGMQPTALAQRLIGPIDAGLAQLSQAVDQGRHFDAATSNRIFRLAINDIGQLIMMPLILAAALERAPLIRFETVDVSHADARQKMQQGQIDLAIGSWDAMGQAFYQQRVCDETFVVLMRKHHPLASGKLTLEDYMAADHVAYRPSGATDTELQQTLLRAGMIGQRNVVLTAAHSLGLSSIVASSNLLLTAPSRLARSMVATRNDLKSQPTPFEVQPFKIHQQWHERYHQDSGNRWLRELIFQLLHEPSAPHPAESPLSAPPILNTLSVVPAGASMTHKRPPAFVRPVQVANG